MFGGLLFACRVDEGWGAGMGKLSRTATALGALPIGFVLAAPAHGIGDAVSDYVADHGGEVCAFMDDQPNLAGVKGAVNHILGTSGLPENQTGRMLAGSVTVDCPEYGGLVDEFVRYVQRRQQQQQNGGIGAVLGY
ncbi:hypothetical protein MSEN_05750 [Mycolicibacter senuensis]|uniref:DUF732 domain-containing protein n=2 Tax=Mycolicibacter senuensis TaxID=386913 RepID=A0A7I9XFY0_9MYCO|nr:hypothetical protein MSEN_05750 [Mycolicibacter senuensis]